MPVLAILIAVPDSRVSSRAAAIAGVVAGVLLLIAALEFYFYWLTSPSRRRAWTVSALVVVAVQVLASSAHDLVDPPPGGGVVGWGTVVDLLATGVVLGLLFVGTRALRNPHPALLGLGLGVALAGLLATGPADHVLGAPPRAVIALLLTTIVAAHVAIAWQILADHSLVDWARHRLALTIVLVGVAQLARSGAFDGWATDLAAAVGQVGAAILWSSATFRLLADTVVHQHRRARALECAVLENESNLRGSRELMHEIRSTVAGAASAARLLDDEAVSPATHARLERAIRTELDRLERMVTDQEPASPGPVDLDTTLDVLLEAHRAQGRTVEWEPSGGATVHARPDDVAEALNILLDNAATHGGGTASRVAVTRADGLVEIAVTDAGPGVPLEAREGIFDWGVHRSDSPGQGIGLSVARRLVTEHGGTLTLADQAAEQGSSFIIRLPAARRSEEDHVLDPRHSA
ncbi:sensor histidine kinase [Nocardioides currus]|uniref:histidine kinase n=1 Tax=Nocardioides currus TaxID=2133958 RepID=A0A2R7Z193_9ACTN|nr:HAMP domain-containing sensor histidine kinase [Nocardioides currus]PUA82334.1 hypothetical protein C7S10_00850 [Nocardioides currus]